MKTKPIEVNGVYTPNEVQEILKISPSTFKRLIRHKKILASKVGGQRRIMGSELVRILTPNL
jgi:excisionase family DNA binding protein